MIVAIHQPNYLPWIGFFDKMDRSDVFVILDRAQHSKSSVTNRNQIKTSQGAHLLSVPLKKKEVPINECLIDNQQLWNLKHWRMIENNYRKSTFWDIYEGTFREIYHQEWERLSDLNVRLILEMKKIFGIETEILIESDMQLDFGKGSARNLNICKTLGAGTYLSGSGASAYNDEDDFERNHVKLVYQRFEHPVYTQQWGEFISHLSALDLLFNHGPESIDIIRKRREVQ